MAEPQIEFAYPVAWPSGRTKTSTRQSAKWRSDGRRLLFDDAVRRLRQQTSMISSGSRYYRCLEMTLSTNFELRADGRPRRGRGTPSDPSVAFYFELDDQPHVLACDRWDTVPDNIAAIAAHIEALRGQERWGVSTMKQAFAGHVALPAPEQWWQVLGLAPNATVEEIESSFRTKAKTDHPDQGGSNANMARLISARKAGREAAAQ